MHLEPRNTLLYGIFSVAAGVIVHSSMNIYGCKTKINNNSQPLSLDCKSEEGIWKVIQIIMFRLTQKMHKKQYFWNIYQELLVYSLYCPQRDYVSGMHRQHLLCLLMFVFGEHQCLDHGRHLENFNEGAAR